MIEKRNSRFLSLKLSYNIILTDHQILVMEIQAKSLLRLKFFYYNLNFSGIGLNLNEIMTDFR